MKWWHWIMIGFFVLGNALNPTLAISIFFRVIIGSINGATSAVMDKEQQPIIINVPQQQNPERGYEAQ